MFARRSMLFKKNATTSAAFPKFLKFILVISLIVVVIALPFFLNTLLGAAWLRILVLALIYALLALGLNVVVGFAGLLDLGYVAFFAVGAYTYALLASPQFGLHISIFWILPFAAFLSGGVGILLGTPTLRLHGDYLAIVTLGFGEIIRIFLNNLNAPINITNGPQGITAIDPIHIGSFSLGKSHIIFSTVISPLYQYYFLLVGFVALSMQVTNRLHHSALGRAWVAMRDDEKAARAMGIEIVPVKLAAFAIGAVFAGIAGVLYAGLQGFVSPESFTLTESVMVLCMVVLGGMGRIGGVVLGALVLAILPEALRYLTPLQASLLGRQWVDPSDLRMLIFGFALVFMMLLRPSGLLKAR